MTSVRHYGITTECSREASWRLQLDPPSAAGPSKEPQPNSSKIIEILHLKKNAHRLPFWSPVGTQNHQKTSTNVILELLRTPSKNCVEIHHLFDPLEPWKRCSRANVSFIFTFATNLEIASKWLPKNLLVGSLWAPKCIKFGIWGHLKNDSKTNPRKCPNVVKNGSQMDK